MSWPEFCANAEPMLNAVVGEGEYRAYILVRRDVNTKVDKIR